MKEPLDLRGFKFGDATMVWQFAPRDSPVVSLAQLLLKFYAEWRWHNKPLGWARNPEKEGVAVFANADVIVAPCRCGFYFVLERQFREIFGPHTMTLYYRSQYVDNEVVWVATAQFNGMWHSDERVREAFFDVIKRKKLYQSETTAALVVLK